MSGPVSNPYISVIEQARISASDPVLKDNFQDLSDEQIALLMKVIGNENNLWKTRTDPELEAKLSQVNVILKTDKTAFTSMLFSKFSEMLKEPVSDFRARRVNLLTDMIQQSEALLTKTRVFEEKTTQQLTEELYGNNLRTDQDLTNQFHRDFYPLKDEQYVWIQGQAINIPIPKEIPKNWNEMIPPELKKFFGDQYEAFARGAATMMTQGIASEPLIIGQMVIHDPLYSQAMFLPYNQAPYEYPHFQFEISAKNEFHLSIKQKGCLSLLGGEDGITQIPLRAYNIIQEINLSDPKALVKITIEPISIQDLNKN